MAVEKAETNPKNPVRLTHNNKKTSATLLESRVADVTIVTISLARGDD